MARPILDVPPRGFRYPKALKTLRVYRSPEAYSATLPYRPRLWNVAPPLSEGSRHYLRRIFGGSAAEHTFAALAAVRAYRRVGRLRVAAFEGFAARYGRGGYLVAGGFLSEWPEPARETMRRLAWRGTAYLDRAAVHWKAAGRRSHTLRAALARV